MDSPEMMTFMWMRGLVYKLPLAGGGRDNEWFHSIGIKHAVVTQIQASSDGSSQREYAGPVFPGSSTTPAKG